MSDHDHLMCELIRLQKLLNEYVDEYAPGFGVKAQEHLGKVLLLANDFPEDPSAL